MFTNIRTFWQAIGVIFTLIALYLILDNGGAFTRIVNSFFRGGNTLARTLQGR